MLKIFGRTKNNLSNKMINNVKPMTIRYLIPNRNYYCEKWNHEQSILQNKNQELNKLNSLNSLKLSDKDIFIYGEIKKNTEQNEKILSLLKQQNEDIEILKKKY